MNLPPHPRFTRRWQALLEHAEALKEDSNLRFQSRRGNLWHDLLGMEWALNPMWTIECRPLVLEMKPFYERWVKERMRTTLDFGAFASFLQTPAANFLICDAFSWFGPFLKAANDWFWHYDHHRREWAGFLGFAWNRHWDEIKRNPESLEAFRILIARLTAYHEPEAMEISSRLVTFG